MGMWSQDCQQIADRLPQADKHGPRNDGVADVQCFQVRHSEDAGRVPIIEAVPCVHAEAEFVREVGRRRQLLDLCSNRRSGPGIGIAASVELNELRADPSCSPDLLGIGIQKDADRNPSATESGDRGRQGSACGVDNIQAALGCELLAFFRDQTGLVGFDFFGESDNGRGIGQFKIEPGPNGLAEEPDIEVGNVSSVLTQVHGDAVSARELGFIGCPDRIGFGDDVGHVFVPGLAQGRHVVNIYAESNHLDLDFNRIMGSATGWCMITGTTPDRPVPSRDPRRLFPCRSIGICWWLPAGTAPDQRADRVAEFGGDLPVRGGR